MENKTNTENTQPNEQLPKENPQATSHQNVINSQQQIFNKPNERFKTKVIKIK